VANFLKKNVRHFKMGGLYLLIPLVGAVSPLILIPALSASYGVDLWGKLAVGQAIGAAFGTVAELGWSAIGPQRIASENEVDRRRTFYSAMSSRIAVTLLLLPFLFVLCVGLWAEDGLFMALMGLANLLAGISNAWFFVGIDKPYAVLLTETVPKLCSAALLAILLSIGVPLLVFLGLQAVLVLAAYIFSVKYAGFDLLVGLRGLPSGFYEIRPMLSITSARLVNVFYNTLPLSLVSLWSPSGSAAFAAADRLARMALMGLSAIPNRLQSWVGGGVGEDKMRRSQRSLKINIFLGTVSAFCFFLFAPLAVHFLFSGKVEIEISTLFAASILVFLVCVSRGCSLSSIASGLQGKIVWSNLAAACFGVPAVVGGCVWLGAFGAMLGCCVGELCGIAVQFYFLRKSHL
jgi:O-antigen/teichoic acid export membrane protein